MSKEIAAVIKRLRKEAGLTLEELGEKIGVSRATAQRYESGGITAIPYENIEKMAEIFNVSPGFIMGWKEPGSKTIPEYENAGLLHNLKRSSGPVDVTEQLLHASRIPVLGTVPAGIPIEAITDIVDYEEISPSLAITGEYFALRVKGNSMAPRICDSDVVIVKKEESVDNGDIAIIMVNGNEATCKEVKFSDNGLTLVGWNVAEFSPMFFTKDEIETMPVRIIGRVVEVRIKNLKAK